MKKIILFAMIALLASCTDDITGLNKNEKDATKVNPDYLFSNAQKALVDQMTSTSVNVNVFRLFSQQWTETTYPDESRYNITNRKIPDLHFRVLYRDVLIDLKEAEMLLNSVSAGANQKELTNKKAIIKILKAYSFSVLVDTFGDVPYTEALDIDKYPSPKYDDAKFIYKSLINELEIASNELDVSEGSASFGNADLIYKGKTIKWKKFANSLLLRLAINMDDVDHSYASEKVMLAIRNGVISSNDENATLNYLDLQPNANPIYNDLVVNKRNDFIPANTLVDAMNELEDPRREKYFTFKPNTSIYEGGIYGAQNTFENYSHITSTLNNPRYPGTLFNYTETEFLLAEAVARNIPVGKTAEIHYVNAIKSSMFSWGVASADIDAYLIKANVVYNASNWKKLIGEQAWIAMYNLGFDAWTSYRRLDYPNLKAPSSASNDLKTVPKRYTYSSAEYGVNEASVRAAVRLLPGEKDDLTNKIFWDKF